MLLARTWMDGLILVRVGGSYLHLWLIAIAWYCTMLPLFHYEKPRTGHHPHTYAIAARRSHRLAASSPTVAVD